MMLEATLSEIWPGIRSAMSKAQRLLPLVLLIASMHEPTQLDKGELNWCQNHISAITMVRKIPHKCDKKGRVVTLKGG